jgi:hypothetical protein
VGIRFSLEKGRGTCWVSVLTLSSHIYFHFPKTTPGGYNLGISNFKKLFLPI